jgi:hypothetical protein
MASATDTASLITQVEDAFEGVTLGDGISLNECEHADSGGSAGVFLERAKEDERSDWRRLVTDDLTNFTVTFCFTDLNGYRFYLPAYMIWTLKNYAVSDSIISDNTIYALDPTRYQFERRPFTRYFDQKQLDAILAFLEFCCQNDDYLDGDVARRNLTLIRELMATSTHP